MKPALNWRMSAASIGLTTPFAFTSAPSGQDTKGRRSAENWSTSAASMALTIPFAFASPRAQGGVGVGVGVDVDVAVGVAVAVAVLVGVEVIVGVGVTVGVVVMVGVSVAVGVVPHPLALAEAMASIRPCPKTWSGPLSPKSIALFKIRSRSPTRSSDGSHSSSSAATPAACGDAADVPKNRRPLPWQTWHEMSYSQPGSTNGK
jgi:hypothetical protein